MLGLLNKIVSWWTFWHLTSDCYVMGCWHPYINLICILSQNSEVTFQKILSLQCISINLVLNTECFHRSTWLFLCFVWDFVDISMCGDSTCGKDNLNKILMSLFPHSFFRSLATKRCLHRESFSAIDWYYWFSSSVLGIGNQWFVGSRRFALLRLLCALVT